MKKWLILFIICLIGHSSVRFCILLALLAMLIAIIVLKNFKPRVMKPDLLLEI